MSGVMVTDTGVQVFRWQITLSADPGPWPAHPKRVNICASQRCCRWVCKDLASALHLVDMFEWHNAHPELEVGDLGDLIGTTSFERHLRHMREGVVFPMKAEEI